ncbi:hypothetical protein EZV61_16110 [Corallincola luteus]|uniref:LRAT domain-containing protein n=1 Tax=Corallincola luteus TaxID=1775177 RepID=A0ABY2AGS8_9GAMM|nr:hypothetical protein [Corallincola luteus]TCI01793.1 hypothetical protein EZV61_16110 [Corallincola luteus]
MKATVYVWPRKDQNVGHAAMKIGSTYISFWPADGIGKPQAKKGLKMKLSHAGTSVTSYRVDCDAEGGRQPIAIEINNFDAESALAYWQQIRRDGVRYQLRKKNCSSIVAECIHAGTNRKPSFQPKAEEYGRFGSVFGYGIWTPAQVLRYATEVNKA